MEWCWLVAFLAATPAEKIKLYEWHRSSVFKFALLYSSCLLVFHRDYHASCCSYCSSSRTLDYSKHYFRWRSSLGIDCSWGTFDYLSFLVRFHTFLDHYLLITSTWITLHRIQWSVPLMALSILQSAMDGPEHACLDLLDLLDMILALLARLWNALHDLENSRHFSACRVSGP